MQKRLALSLMGFGLSTFLMGSATMAWFTHEVTVPQNSFVSGRVEMNLDRPSPVVWSGSFGNMAPGETVHTNLTVKNTGTLDMKYRFYAGTNGDAALARALVLEVKKGADTLYSGPLDGLDLAHAVIRDGCNALVPSGGATTDRSACTNAAATSEVLTFSVTLPASAGNDLASKSVTASFIFRATQTANPGWDQTAP